MNVLFSAVVVEIMMDSLIIVRFTGKTVPMAASIPYARLYTQHTHTNHTGSADRLIAMTSRCPYTQAYKQQTHTHSKPICPCGDGSAGKVFCRHS